MLEWLAHRALVALLRASARVMQSRPPDHVIGDPRAPYLLRWWLLPRNRLLNLYLHVVARSDDARALHDHPWANCSYVLAGGYVEHRIAAGGCHLRDWRGAGSLVFRRAAAAHRLELPDGCFAVTLFMTGPRVRDWGFHCPDAGWVHWQSFTAGPDGATIGRGCGEHG